MAVVNRTIYPDVDATSPYYTTTLNLSGSNFIGYLDTGLEHSITYTASTNPRAPYRNGWSCDMATDEDASKKYVSSPSTIQRIALAYAWPQNFGSDVCSTQQILNHPWNSQYSVSNNLYSAFQWNGICGRILCTYYTSHTDNDIYEGMSYKATWKQFKDEIRNNPNTDYVLTSVWAADVKGGNPTGRRSIPLKAISLYKYDLKWWNFYEGKEENVGSNFIYGCMRPASSYAHTLEANLQDNAANSPDMCWPIYNYGYGVGGYTPNAFYGARGATSQMINGKLTFGVDPGVSDTVYRLADEGGNRTFGIAVSQMGVEGLIDYIEEKAACLGIILFQDQLHASSTTGDPGIQGQGVDNKDISTLQDVFSYTDIFVPITDDEGYFNGDFLVYGDDPTGTSAETMIQGTKDTPFIDGADTDDPAPANQKAEFYFNKDNFNLVYGANTTTSSDYWDGNPNQEFPIPGDPNVCFYYTPKIDPWIRFTSRVDNTEYKAKVSAITGQGFIFDGPVRKLVDTGSDPIIIEVYYQLAGAGIPYFMAYRQPYGRMTETEMAEMSYADMKGTPNGKISEETPLSLGKIINYFNLTHPTFGPDDVFTEIHMDFYEYDQNTETNLLGSLICDYSSLYGSGIDPRTDDGSGSGPGSSWDPLPGHENDKDESDLNPDNTNNIDLNRPTLGPYGLFNRTYAINATGLSQLGELISTTDDHIIDEILDGLKMFGSNPMDALIDLRLYPFNVPAVANNQAVVNMTNLTLGRYVSPNIFVVPIEGNNCLIDMGSIYIQPKYNSFLDYEPYTTMRLYIPYVGTIELPPTLFMGKTVGIRLIVDFVTGAATAIIFANGIPITYQNGVVGVSIPITGNDAAQYSNSIIGNLVGAIGSAAGAVASLATGNVAGGVIGGISAVSDLISMGQSANDIKFQQAGSSSPATETWLPQKCHIMIARPELNFETETDMELFGETIGFATAYSCRIMDLANTGIYYGILAEHMGAGGANEPIPTAKEVDMMKQILNNGFFVN